MSDWSRMAGALSSLSTHPFFAELIMSKLALRKTLPRALALVAGSQSLATPVQAPRVQETCTEWSEKLREHGLESATGPDVVEPSAPVPSC